MATARTPLRSVGLNAIRIIVVAVSSFGVSVIKARALGASQMGTYAFALWVASSVMSLSALGFPETIARYVAQHRSLGDLALSRKVARWIVLAQIVAAAVASLFTFGIWGAVAPQELLIIALAVGTILPLALQQTLMSLMGGSERFDLQLKVSIWDACVQFAVAAVCAFLHASVAGFLTGSLVAYALFATVSYVLCRPMLHGPAAEIGSQEFRSLLSRMGKFSIAVYAIFPLEIIVWDKSEMFFLRHFRSSADVAFYSIAFNITCRLTTLIGCLSNVSFPIFVERYSTSGPAAVAAIYGKAMRYAQIVMIPICIWPIAIVPQFVHFAYGKQYAGVSPILQILLAGWAISATANLGVNAIYAMERQNFFLRFMLGMALASLALDFVLIPRYGAVGAALANGIAQSGAALGLMMKLRSLMPGCHPPVVSAKIYFAALVAAVPVFCSALLLRVGVPVLVLAVAAAIAIYAAILTRTKAIDRHEWRAVFHGAATDRFENATVEA